MRPKNIPSDEGLTDARKRSDLGVKDSIRCVTRSMSIFRKDRHKFSQRVGRRIVMTLFAKVVEEVLDGQKVSTISYGESTRSTTKFGLSP